MLNTLFVATTVTVLKVFLDSMAGYALAKLDFTGKRVVFLLMLILLMVPFGGCIDPALVARPHAAHHQHLPGAHPAAAGQPAGRLPDAPVHPGLPKDLENAARLDGVSEFGIYWRIILPLVKPGLVVLAVIIFTDQFMSFIWPLIATTSDDLQVLTVGVAAFAPRAASNLRPLVGRGGHVARADRHLLLRVAAPVPGPVAGRSAEAMTVREPHEPTQASIRYAIELIEVTQALRRASWR